MDRVFSSGFLVLTNSDFVSSLVSLQHRRRQRGSPEGLVSLGRHNASVCLKLCIFLVSTNFGIDGTFWDFTSNLAKGDTAYTTLALGAHTDTTYFVGIPPLVPLPR